jgi:hypothetical protein
VPCCWAHPLLVVDDDEAVNGRRQKASGHGAGIPEEKMHAVESYSAPPTGGGAKVKQLSVDALAVYACSYG